MNYQLPEKKKVNILNLDNTLVESLDLEIVNPINELASEAVVESSRDVYLRVGTRLTIKHVAAIMTSFATYRALGGKDNVWAKNASVLQYAALSRVILESEKAMMQRGFEEKRESKSGKDEQKGNQIRFDEPPVFRVFLVNYVLNANAKNVDLTLTLTLSSFQCIDVSAVISLHVVCVAVVVVD